ncbi:hypothetical protein [Polynucleobacter sp. KF022]|nr:hypothetical protein [Polynucleobacter sp. KF022]
MAIGRSMAAAMPPHIRAQCQPLTRALKKTAMRRLEVNIRYRNKG